MSDPSKRLSRGLLFHSVNKDEKHHNCQDTRYNSDQSHIVHLCLLDLQFRFNWTSDYRAEVLHERDNCRRHSHNKDAGKNKEDQREYELNRSLGS